MRFGIQRLLKAVNAHRMSWVASSV